MKEGGVDLVRFINQSLSETAPRADAGGRPHSCSSSSRRDRGACSPPASGPCYFYNINHVFTGSMGHISVWSYRDEAATLVASVALISFHS